MMTRLQLRLEAKQKMKEKELRTKTDECKCCNGGTTITTTIDINNIEYFAHDK